MENTTVRTKGYPGPRRFELVQGDLTSEGVDAIVNAANSQLAHGGGVAGLISRKGGPVIQAESTAWVRKHGLVSHDQPAYTSAGALPCRYVIHAVGPVWGEGSEDKKLADAVMGSLRLANQLSLSSIALPAISTGIFGFPKDRAARVIIHAIDQYFQDNPETSLTLTRLVIYDQETLKTFTSEFDRLPQDPS